MIEEEFGKDSSEFNPPATAEEIENWEKNNKIIIPSSYKEWLAFSNGSEIYNSMAIFYALDEFVINNEEKPYNVPDV